MDPGLATFGIVALDVTPSTELELPRVQGDVITCRTADVFTSEPSAKKLGHAMADERVWRARQLAAWVRAWIDAHEPHYVAAEAMSFPRGAHAITAISLAWGVIAAELDRRSIALVTAYPTAWRRFLVRGGREVDAHAEAVRRVPSFAAHGRRIKPPETQLHALDALGVACWSLSTDVAMLWQRSAR